MDELSKLIVPGVIGLITGAIGSLIAPWLKWGIEKKQLRLNARREFIARVRRTLSADADKEQAL